MTGHQLIRLIKSTLRVNIRQSPVSQRFMKIRAHHGLSSHPQRRQLANYFSSTSTHPNAAIEHRNLVPRCPTCTAEIKTNFNLTNRIEDKCKCSHCQSFLPTQMVVKLGNDQSYLKGRNDGGTLVDYFKLFELEKKFLGLDLLKLKKSFHLWQQIVHPDFGRVDQHNPSHLSLTFMKDWSVLINRAKDILSGDLTRAEYLIELCGNIPLASETDSSEDMGLLMEIMEAREQLEAAKTREEVEAIQSSNQQSIQQVLILLNQKFIKLIHNQHLERDEINLLKDLIIRLRYLENIKKIILSTHL